MKLVSKCLAMQLLGYGAGWARRSRRQLCEVCGAVGEGSVRIGRCRSICQNCLRRRPDGSHHGSLWGIAHLRILVLNRLSVSEGESFPSLAIINAPILWISLVYLHISAVREWTTITEQLNLTPVVNDQNFPSIGGLVNCGEGLERTCPRRSAP